MSAWVVLIIVAREFAVTGLRLVAAGGAEVIGASQLGKLKTFSQNVMVVCLLLAAPDARWTDIVVAIALVLTMWSFADYFWRGRHHFLAARRARAPRDRGRPDRRRLSGGLAAFGYWLVRIFRHQDIRTLGSKNTGMTNVWRNFGWRFGVATLLLDVAKGAMPVLAALHWSGRSRRRSRASRRCSGTAIRCCSASAAARASHRRRRRAGAVPGGSRDRGARVGDRLPHHALRLTGVAHRRGGVPDRGDRARADQPYQVHEMWRTLHRRFRPVGSYIKHPAGAVHWVGAVHYASLRSL